MAIVGVEPMAATVVARFADVGDRVLRVACDPADSSAAGFVSSIEELAHEHGGIDVLVHVLDESCYPLRTAGRCIEAVAAMRAAPPTVLIVGSVQNGEPLDWHDYSALAALRAVTQGLAADHRAAGVRVNAVAVLRPAELTGAARDQVEQALGDALTYLASPSAALLAGQCLSVDGGLATTTPRRAVVVTKRSESAPATVSTDAVVVVGMGVALPGASSPEELWDLLCDDRPVFREPGDRLDLATLWSAAPSLPDHTYSRVSGFMFGFRPHRSLATAPGDHDEYTATWLRHCIAQATDGVVVRASDRRVFAVGLTADGSHHLEQSLVVGEVRRLLGERDESTDALLRELYPLAIDAPEQVLPYRIARQAAADLPADTEIVVVDTACSSSLYSIDLGVRALRSGEADLALCGGAFALSAQNLVLFAKLSGLSRSGKVRPLDRAADGVLFSDGAAVLALKTHSRARADGDRVLGFIAGFGGSSDGRGKAIYAPNPVGQRIALRRAWSAASVEPANIDWVIAHATGTPTGDRTELSVLAEVAGPGKTWTVTSNKSLVGHSGWAAGAVSAVHALLALRHEVIPAQRHFTQLPVGLDSAVISVPADHLAWPAQQNTPRIVAVSAMGFGGTNGHLLLTDTPPARPEPAPRLDESIVITTWAAHLPGDPDQDRIRRWMAGAQPDWPVSFGDNYPLPSPVDLRLTPSAIAAMDRSQLMAVRCADLLNGPWAADRGLAARSGVFVGHTGPTRAAILHDTRCYLADLAAKAGPRIPRFEQLVVEPVRAAIPAATEDSYPGLMPNIIPARIAQRLDLHGPNMALDAGLDSFASALATAVRYLSDGEIDLAMVIGVGAAAACVQPRGDRVPAEAAIGFLVTRQSIARAQSMPVLAQLGIARRNQDSAASANATSLVPGHRVHHGAEGAVALLRVLHGAPGQTVITAQEDAHTPVMVVTVPPALRQTASEVAVVPPAQGSISALDKVMQRHSLVLRPTPARAARQRLAALPEGTVVVTDDPAAVRAFGLPAHCFVIAPGLGTFDADPRIVSFRDTRTVSEPLASSGRTIEHVRVVLTGTDARNPEAFRTILAVNDLAFAAMQTCAGPLGEGGSAAVLVLDGFDRDVPRPAVGLFTGLVRSLEQELPGCLTFALVTDTRDVARGLAQLAEETAHHRYLPVAYLRAGTRLELMLDQLPPGEVPGRLGVVADPVIVATGGARGLTARLVRELLSDGPPRGVWLLGTAPVPNLTATATLPPKQQALRDLMARHPGEKLAALNGRYQDAVRDADRIRTILDLQRSYGADRIHYRQCDVRDANAVAAVMGEVLAIEGRVDVVVHGAGLVRSTALARKDIGDYRLVRDVKVLGDRNLRAALADHPPALWCSISSVGAFIGMRGEADYEAGNEYLLLAAAGARAAGRDEVALVSGLWVESGMAAGYTVGTPFTTGLADFTQLTDEQGSEFFRAELAGRGGPGLATTWVGAAEWSTLHRAAPGLRDAGRAGQSLAGRPAFLTEPPHHASGEAVWRFEVSLDRHPWLLDHLVDDRPTVPATVMLEMAAEAAVQLAPGLVPVRMTDVVLSRFIRAPRTRWPRPLQVNAARTGDTVLVRISSPAAGPVPAREHARITVWVADAPTPTEPHRDRRPPGTEVPDVYQLDGPVQLSGVFSALRQARLHDNGGSAVLYLPTTGDPLDSFLLPSITLDSVLRAVVLDGRRPESISLIVPTELAAIDFFAVGNDRQLVQQWSEGITLQHWSDPAGAGSHCAAVTGDGTVLLRISGISASVRAVYDLTTDRWRSSVTPAVA